MNVERNIDVHVVDDDDDDHVRVRTSFAAVLQDAGYTTAEGAACTAALEALEQGNVHAVLLDVYLPGLTGLSLLDQLEHPPSIVLLTGQGYDHGVLVRRHKVFSYAQTPVVPAGLLFLIARAVAGGTGGGRWQVAIR